MNIQSRQSILLDLGVSEGSFGRLHEYMSHLWEANVDLNLFSRKMTESELLDNHLIDCLLPLKQFPADAHIVADFGSGGGMPGVIYAILFPNIQFHLYEKSPKKQVFLKSCQKLAANIQVYGDIPSELPNVDWVVSRAFKPIDVMLEMSRDYFLNGGRYFLLKGRKEKIEEELQVARKKFESVVATVIPLRSPVMDVERHLVLI
jgi:16S rRNA (guanine527-N7)-methyltransferase